MKRTVGRPREFDHRLVVLIDDELSDNVNRAARSLNLVRSDFVRSVLARACNMVTIAALVSAQAAQGSERAT